MIIKTLTLNYTDSHTGVLLRLRKNDLISYINLLYLSAYQLLIYE